MTTYIEYQNQTIKYSLKKYKRSKRIRIIIFPNGKITVTAPKLTPLSLIKIFLNQKIDWITKILNQQPALPLKSINSKTDYIKNKKTAYQLTMEKINIFNQHYNFTFNKVFIRNQTTRWGSCSSNKNLNFNHRLINLPDTLIDYLIVHELCHLQHMNHSPDFWSLVSQTIPDYKNRRRELRLTGKNLF